MKMILSNGGTVEFETHGDDQFILRPSQFGLVLTRAEAKQFSVKVDEIISADEPIKAEREAPANSTLSTSARPTSVSSTTPNTVPEGSKKETKFTLKPSSKQEG